jgi:hypothetical protein
MSPQRAPAKRITVRVVAARSGEDWCVPERAPPTREPRPTPEKVSNQIERWLASDRDKTFGGLIDVFQEKASR